MIVMQSQFPFRSYNVSSGNVYVADQYGIIPAVVSVADQKDLVAAGCATITPQPNGQLGSLVCNFNVSTDQIIPLNNAIRFQILRILVMNASISLNTAVGGIYTLPAKAGTPVVSAAQSYAALTGAFIGLDLTISDTTIIYPASTNLYFSLTTPQGVAASADLYVYANALP